MQISVAPLIAFIIGLIAGAVTAYLSGKSRAAEKISSNNATALSEHKALEEKLGVAQSEVTSVNSLLVDARKEAELLREKLSEITGNFRENAAKLGAELVAKEASVGSIKSDLTDLTSKYEAAISEISDLKASLAEVNANLAAERTQANEKIALINEAKDQLSNQFKALANEILDDKSKKFTEQNQSNIDQLLRPLKQQLTDFKAKVEEVYVNEGKDRSALGEQVRQLIALNTALSEDAQNLTSALKGDRKAQGNWGELILDDVLEKAGLRAGQHYRRQDAVKGEDGLTHVIPDVILDLPGDRHLVIDSKLTLPDYRAFASAGDDEERAQALKRHVTSIRNHIKGLSEKNYQSLYGLSSLDFVVMFVPLEPAFMLAVTNDVELFQNAWERNVLLVSPSTLLFVVRTVANLWRQEGLSRNAQAISARGAELYDKLAAFVSDLEKIGSRLQQAQDSYVEAKKKLSSGKGNVLRQAEMLKDLGVKPTKTLPQHLLEDSSDSELPALNQSARIDLPDASESSTLD